MRWLARIKLRIALFVYGWAAKVIDEENKKDKEFVNDVKLSPFLEALTKKPSFQRQVAEIQKDGRVSKG